MIVSILIALYLYLILDRLFFPWHYIDGEPYNILGKNKYNQTREERMKEFEEQVKELSKNKNFR